MFSDAQNCSDCAKRHIGQAAARMLEIGCRHPGYQWIVVGHLACAEEEMLGTGMELEIGAHREALERDAEYVVPFLKLLERFNEDQAT